MSHITQVPEVGDSIIIVSRHADIDFIHGDRFIIYSIFEDTVYIKDERLNVPRLPIYRDEFYIVKNRTTT